MRYTTIKSSLRENVLPRHFIWVQIATVALFLGRAWQHIRWDGPYRSLFWDEVIMKPLVVFFTSMTWTDYATDPRINAGIVFLTKTIGWCFLGCAGCTFLLLRIGRKMIWIGVFLLVFLSVLETKAHFGQLAFLLEYTLQWFTPILFLLGFGYMSWQEKHIQWAAWACSLTFIGHGLYALGWFPRPGHFIQMTLDITGWSESNCILFLKTAGWLDLIVAVGIQVPWRRIRIWSAGYMVFWGSVTALARIVAHFVPDYWQNSLAQWLHEVIFRMPHGLIPLFLLFIWTESAVDRKKKAIDGFT
ncbi:MAG: hypothetical protein HRU40_20375 [Saprospiraceae bacterium]|nr:hypothetical protein [Saprospiraceae bacterium]